MTARRVAYAALVGTAGAAGWYFFAYLTRWEWNRALVSALIFLAAELGLIGALLLDRVQRLRNEIGALRDRPPTVVHVPEPEARPDALRRVREAAPPREGPFEWLDPDRTTVFIPVLLGAGVIVSALAWAVERLARFTAGARLEQDLAARLGALALPESLLVPRGERRRVADTAHAEDDVPSLLHPSAFDW
jgi:hypothetical protein